MAFPEDRAGLSSSYRAEWLHVAASRGGARWADAGQARRACAGTAATPRAHSHAVGDESAGRLGPVRFVRQRRRMGGRRETASSRRGADRFVMVPQGSARRARAVQDESWNERDPQLPKSRWWFSDGPFVGFRLVREISRNEVPMTDNRIPTRFAPRHLSRQP